MNSGSAFHWFVYQQDYLWFLNALGWAAWWRLGRKDKSLPWLPWAAGAAILTAGLEVSQLITPVEMKPFAAPWLVWDLALGGVHALLAGGLWWTLARAARWSPWKIAPALALAAAAAALRQPHPAAGSAALTVLVLAAAVWLVRLNRVQGAARLALLALPATVLLATNGPLAEALQSPHRYTEISVYGLAASITWLVALGAVGRALYRRTGEQPDSAVTRADLLQLVRAQAVWLAFGLVLAAIMSHWARASFEANLLSRVRMAAELVDKKYLATTLGPDFRVDEIESVYFLGNELTYYRSEYLSGNRLDPLATSLSTIELANRDADWARIITMRQGWLLAHSLSSRMPKPIKPGVKGRFGRPDERTWQAWSEHRAEVVGPVNFYYGYVVQARAPLVSADNKMLGWLILDLGVAHWLAAQLQARLLAFAVIAIGSALLTANWQQRVRERVRAAARREADAALAANRIKSTFLAKVSHELRTPIQSLLGYSELLRDKVSDDPKAAGWLGALQQHGVLMTRLVNDLIDLSAVEAGAFQLSARPVEPANVVAQTVESFRPRAEARSLLLACFVDPAVPAWVSLDGERFRQVLTNLVANAIKFTVRGGVTVALRPETGDRLVLTVRDTGPGIPPGDQARLFVAFSRLETTAATEGSGLGLALSAALCRAMGGDLGVASDGVTGSCFTAIFHAPAAAGPESAKSTDPLATLRGHRVLVVDDNPLVRELFIAFLSEQGALVASAGSGAEAVAQANAGSFDAIILDLALPDGDGTEFVRPLRTAAGAARLIGVSAHASTADRARALAAGMEAFLTKPVPLGALAAAVCGGPDRPPEEAPAFRTAVALRERLARHFIRELPEQQAELAAALTLLDWPRVRALAHNLKNSAVVVRDDGLFDACTGLELAAEAGDEAITRLWWARVTPHLARWRSASDHAPSSASQAENQQRKKT
jgi:signal transduction histidine kinase/CheY-like chemotaxis protein